jgi:hypothetical protein
MNKNGLIKNEVFLNFKGLYMQYGVKRLEFDEIFDKEQMIRVGNKILNQI